MYFCLQLSDMENIYVLQIAVDTFRQTTYKQIFSEQIHNLLWIDSAKGTFFSKFSRITSIAFLYAFLSKCGQFLALRVKRKLFTILHLAVFGHSFSSPK